MLPVWPNHQLAAEVLPKVLRSQLLLHHDPTHSVVVVIQALSRTRPAKTPLQRIQDVFEAIVNIVDEEALLAVSLPQVQKDGHFKQLAGAGLEPVSRSRSQDGVVDGLAPLLVVTLIAWKDNLDRTSSLGRCDLLRLGGPLKLPLAENPTDLSGFPRRATGSAFQESPAQLRVPSDRLLGQDAEAKDLPEDFRSVVPSTSVALTAAW
jgi:hypothetical protein